MGMIPQRIRPRACGWYRPKSALAWPKMTSTENAGMQGYNPSNGKGLSLLGALRRRWPIIVITMLICGGAAAALALATNKNYESTATLVFRQTIAPQLNSIGLIPNTVAADNLAEDNRERVASKAVAVDASEALAARGVDMSPADIQDDVTVVGDKQSDVVKLTASADDAQRAALLANVYAASAKRLAANEDQELARMALGSLRRQFEALPTNVQNHVSGPGAQLRNNMQKMQVIADVGNGSPQIVQPGYVPTDKSGSPVTTILLGLLLGAVLGSGLALLRDQSDRRLHGAEEAAVAFDAPVLTTVPRHRALKRNVPFADLPPEVAEAFRMLQMNLRFAWDEPISSLVLTSSRAGEGKTTVAWNLSYAALSAGMSVALVEADMRRPTLADRHGLQPGPGVTEVVEGRASLEDALQPLTNLRVDRHGRQLDVLVAGQLPPDPWAVLQSDAMGWILKTLKRDHDLVVVDTPPLPHVADAISLLGQVDGVVVAASANSTRGDDARRLREQLQGLDARVLGVVVNRGSAIGGYGYVPSIRSSASPAEHRPFTVDDPTDVNLRS